MLTCVLVVHAYCSQEKASSKRLKEKLQAKKKLKKHKDRKSSKDKKRSKHKKRHRHKEGGEREGPVQLSKVTPLH